MPRKKSGHTGSDDYQVLLDKFRQVADKQFSVEIEGWNTFSVSEREFLAVRGFYKTSDATGKALGYKPRWFAKRCWKNPVLKAALEQTLRAQLDVYEAYVRDLVGKGLMCLSRMLEPEYDDSAIQLKAVQYILGLVGVGVARNTDAGIPKTYLAPSTDVKVFKGASRRGLGALTEGSGPEVEVLSENGH